MAMNESTTLIPYYPQGVQSLFRGTRYIREARHELRLLSKVMVSHGEVQNVSAT